MLRGVFLLSVLACAASQAAAAELEVTFRNDSAVTVASVSVTAKDLEPPVELSILPAALQQGDSVDVVFASEDGFCQFAMNIVFADGTSQFREDADFCEPSVMVIE
jgi:hypothetical protein